jgi:hypothetical protein
MYVAEIRNKPRLKILEIKASNDRLKITDQKTPWPSTCTLQIEAHVPGPK